MGQDAAQESAGTHDPTPHDPTPHDVVAHDVVAHDAVPHDATPHDVVPHDATPHDVVAHDVVAIARAIAERAHAGQRDKAGAPYIGHPARVAARLAGDASAQAAAWLHDVVEDTATTPADLARAGVPDEVVAAVDALSHRAGEAPEDYLARVAADPLALRVKRADLADNTDPRRLAALDPALRERLTAKYAAAHRHLERLTRGPGPTAGVAPAVDPRGTTRDGSADA